MLALCRAKPPYDSINLHGGGIEKIIKIILEPGKNGVSNCDWCGKSSYHSVEKPQIWSAGSQSYTSSLIPQIVQIVLGQHEKYEKGIALQSELLHHYGHKGHAVVSEGRNENNDFYRSGRVVQKGTLEINKMPEMTQKGR